MLTFGDCATSNHDMLEVNITSNYHVELILESNTNLLTATHSSTLT